VGKVTDLVECELVTGLDTAEIKTRVVHRLVYEGALAGTLSKLKSGQESDQKMHTRIGVPEGGSALGRDIVFARIPACSGGGGGSNLCDRLVNLQVFILRSGRESLDSTVDTFGVELVDYFPAEAEFVHCARVEVFDEDIGALDQLGKNLLAVGCSRIESQ